MTTSLLAAVLAGGRSTRMGRDKAALPWRGGTLPGHVCTAATDAGLAVLVVGRPGLEGFCTLADEHPGEGPLAALASVLAVHAGPVLLLACDLPRIDAEAVRWLSSMPSGADGAVLEVGGRLQPCCGLYQPSCLALTRGCLASGRRSLHALLDVGDFTRHACPEGIAARFADVDTVEEWERVQGDDQPC